MFHLSTAKIAKFLSNKQYSDTFIYMYKTPRISPRRGIIETLRSEPQPDGGGEEEGGEDCPGEDVPCPFRNVGLGDFDGDGDFLGDLDDFLFFRNLGGDGEGGALVLYGVAEVAGGDGGGGCGKGGLDGGCRVGRGDDDRLDRKRGGDDGVADGHGAGHGCRVMDGDRDDARAA